MHILLGSRSPRRAEIFTQLCIPFRQVPSEFDEEAILFNQDPKSYARELAERKAALLAIKYPEDLIVTADTVVHCDGKVYNKPRDLQEAASFLKDLSGRWHEVYTAVSARRGSIGYSEVDETRILFHPLSEEMISLYLKAFLPLDMAGAYAIQEGGGLLIARMDGCFYNVMGLSINALKVVLLKMGIDIWNFLKK